MTDVMEMELFLLFFDMQHNYRHLNKMGNAILFLHLFVVLKLPINTHDVNSSHNISYDICAFELPFLLDFRKIITKMVLYLFCIDGRKLLDLFLAENVRKRKYRTHVQLRMKSLQIE